MRWRTAGGVWDKHHAPHEHFRFSIEHFDSSCVDELRQPNGLAQAEQVEKTACFERPNSYLLRGFI